MSEANSTDDARPDGGHHGEPQRLDAELQRLAQKGTQHRNSLETAADAERRRVAYRHLRIAVGSYRGSAMKRTLLAIATCASLVAVVTVHVTAPALDIAVISIAMAVLLALTLLVAPLASERAVAAEARWGSSVPFPLEGYFEVLSGTPQIRRTIIYDISWLGDEAPDATFLENVVAGIDPTARVEECNAKGARLVSGPVSGVTNVKNSSHSYVTSNHAIPSSVHAFVDHVLLSLHRRYPLARVSLTSR